MDFNNYAFTGIEKQVASFLVWGYRDADIAREVGRSEQVIRNSLGRMFKKTGTTGRLELAILFHVKEIESLRLRLEKVTIQRDQWKSWAYRG